MEDNLTSTNPLSKQLWITGKPMKQTNDHWPMWCCDNAFELTVYLLFWEPSKKKLTLIISVYSCKFTLNISDNIKFHIFKCMFNSNRSRRIHVYLLFSHSSPTSLYPSSQAHWGSSPTFLQICWHPALPGLSHGWTEIRIWIFIQNVIILLAFQSTLTMH